MNNRQRLFAGLCMIVAGVWLIGWGIGDIKFLFQILPFALLAGLTAGFVVYAVRLKRLLISVLSSPNRRAASAAEFKSLDIPTLERLSRDWEKLGFVQYGEFATEHSAQTSFSRIFEHNSAGAIVEIIQQFQGAKAHPLSSSVTSLWGDPNARAQVEQMAHRLDEITDSSAPLASASVSQSASSTLKVNELPLWILVTHNHAPNRFFSLFRQPRVMGARLPRESSATDIWHAHLERNKLVEARLNQPLFHDELPSLVYAAGRVTSALIVKRLKATPLWKLMPYRFARDSSVPTHYDGELAPLN